MTERPPYRDAVVLLTTHASAELMDRIKRENVEVSKKAVRNALGRPRQSDQPKDPG